MGIVNSTHLDDIKSEHNREIIKYLDFGKFVRMLQTDDLHFHKAAQLGDNFEGSIPKDVYSAREKEYKEAAEEGRLPEHAHAAHEEINRRLRKFTYLNCWHLDSGESLAMWDQYGGSDRAVAIKSTIGDLIEALKKDDRDVYLGKVNYRKYADDETDPDDNESLDTAEYDDGFFLTRSANSLSPFIYKREGYRYEHEVRAIIQETPIARYEDETIIDEEGFTIDLEINTEEGKEYLDLTKDSESGYDLDIFTDDLIQTVYTAPEARGWFKETVEEALDNSEATAGERDGEDLIADSILDTYREPLF